MRSVFDDFGEGADLNHSLYRYYCIVKAIGFFCAACLLAGCGNEPAPEQPAASAPPAAAQPAPDNRPTIVAFGDSLTEGFGVDPARSYPAVLQRLIDRAGKSYHVVNAGVSGETSMDGLARVDLVLGYKPKIVIVEFGGNDGLRGVPVAVTRSNLEQIVERLQSGGVQVVLAGMKLPPNYGPEYVAKFEALFPALAAKYRLKLIPFLLEGVGGNARFMQRDGLHPNARGYAMAAGNVMRVLRPML